MSFLAHLQILYAITFKTEKKTMVLCHSIDCFKISIFGLMWYTTILISMSVTTDVYGLGFGCHTLSVQFHRIIFINLSSQLHQNVLSKHFSDFLKKLVGSNFQIFVRKFLRTQIFVDSPDHLTIGH